MPLHILLGLVLGSGLGLGAALLAEAMFAGLTTGEEVERRLGARYLTGIPLLASVAKRAPPPIDAVVAQPRSAFAEAFRTLRTSLRYAVPGTVRTVAITSALPGEGKTTLSICLARTAALGGERVVLVDCDLRRRGASNALGMAGDAPGLGEVLAGTATLDQALVTDVASGAALLLASSMIVDIDIARGDALDRLLDELATRFDLIILDTPPLLAIAHARLIAAKADATVFVLRWRKTADHVAKAALRLLPRSHATIAGVVLGQVDLRRQRHFGHGDAAAYHAQYKDYYA